MSINMQFVGPETCFMQVNECKYLIFMHSQEIDVIFVFFAHKKFYCSFIKLWTILTMSLLPFWALNVTVLLLYMQGQKALRLHQKYLNFCSENELRLQKLTIQQVHVQFSAWPQGAL